VLALLAGTTGAVAQGNLPRQERPSGYNVPPKGSPAPAAPASEPGAIEEEPEIRVNVDENMIVDLHVSDEELGTVLEMLSLQSQKNIIASKNVSARVTANLYGVTFFEALDAILNINGYGYIEQGNFVMVYTLDELKVMEQQARQRVSKVLTLNFLNATDAASFVTPLLSTGEGGSIAGSIKTNGKAANFPAMGDVPLGSEEYAHTSMLVVYDYEENVAEIEALLRQIDTRPAQVLVEATILQTSLNEANAFGVDFSLIADMDFADFVSLGGPLQATNALIGGRAGAANPLPADGEARAVSTSIGNVAGPAGLKVGVVSNDVAVFLRVLDEVTDTTILSNPKILTLNRQPSRVLVGRKVGYLSTTSTDTSTTQTVQFLDTGTQLYFRPFVTNDGLIRMELKPQVSEAVIREANDATGAAVTIPDEITNELNTNVMVRDGQTVVLGGLFRESTESTRRQVPFLGDIPIIGTAFRGHDDTTERNEIIFLVTPTIMNDASLAATGARGNEYVGRALAGAREGVLPWSRDRLTTMLNVEADDNIRSGDSERALWLTQRSLALNPNQPEVIGLREKISTKKTEWPERSILNRVIKGESENIIRRAPRASGNMGNNPSFQNAEGSGNAGFGASNESPSANAMFNTDSTNNGIATGNDGSAGTVEGLQGDAFQPENFQNNIDGNDFQNAAPGEMPEGNGQTGAMNTNTSFETDAASTANADATKSTAQSSETARLFFGNNSVLDGFFGFVHSMKGSSFSQQQGVDFQVYTNASEGVDLTK
jgi:type IV pilus secretin PilQ/predicted competence protein